MRTYNFILFVSVLIIAFCLKLGIINAQTFPIKMKLHQPPVGLLNASNLWKATLNNTSNKDMKIYLEGFAEEQKDGKIVKGKTNVFTIKPGSKDYQYQDFKDGTVNWFKKKYEDIIMRTGNAPAGTYTICMTAKDEQGDVVGMEQCITQIIMEKTESGITLISPVNGDTLTSGNINFIWSPPMPTPKGKISYELKIVELTENQSGENAIKRNLPFYEEKGLIKTQLSLSSSKLNLKARKKYAWQITCGQISSDIYLFTVLSEQEYKISFESIICGANYNEYVVKMMVINNHPTIALKIVNVQCYTPVINFDCLTGPVNPPLGQSISNISPTLTSTQIPASGGSTIFTLTCLKGSTNDNYFNFRITHQFLNSNGGFDCDSIKIPVCSCCEDFITNVGKLAVTESNGNYFLGGYFTAGPKQICKIQAEMVYFDYNHRPLGNNNCNSASCLWPSSRFGNFDNPVSSVGTLNPTLTNNPLVNETYSREIIWKGNAPITVTNLPFSVRLSLPSLLPSLWNCYHDSIRMCIRFSFTDVSCLTCDTVICFKFTRGPVSPLIFGVNKNLNENLYGNLEAGAVLGNNLKIKNSLRQNDLSFEKKSVQQNNSMIWVFGMNAGLNFNTMSPFPGSAINTSEGCAVFTDMIGNLKFYTDGRSVWNSLNVDIQNGNGLMGSSSSTQSAIIVPYPNSNYEKFYIFTVPAAEVNFNDNARWNLIEFNSTWPNGNVSSKNNLLIRSACEKLTVVPDNLCGYWVMIHGYGTLNGGNFYAYKIDNNGLNLTPVVSTVGSQHIANKGQGQMKISPDRKKIALVSTYDNFLEIFDFNITNGEVTNPIKVDLRGNFGYPYGLEFSPNSQFVYVTTTMSQINVLYQFRISSLNNSSNWSTGTELGKIVGTEKYYYGELQLGPNNRIYVARNNETRLGVINLPDNDGLLCSFIDLSQDISGTCKLGLPAVIKGDPLCETSDCPACCDSFYINIKSVVVKMGLNWCVDSYLTTGPNNITEVKAAMVNFYINEQEGCDRCIKPEAYIGTLFPGNPNSSGIKWPPPSGQLVPPINTGGTFGINVNPRELVWNKMVGGNLEPRPKLDNERVTVRILIPEVLNNICCIDTIRFCVRWTFTDVNCKTCDTLICYTVIQNWDGSSNYQKPNIDVRELEKQLKLESEKQYNELITPENNFQNSFPPDNSNGQSTGMINFDISKDSKVKLTLFDIQGKEIINLYNNNLKTGQYNYNLNNYNLPDGVYLYKLEIDKEKEIKKVAVMKPCNCGKK